MLSITKDIEVANGIKASKHPEFVFITKENVEESYSKIMEEMLNIVISDGKYSLMVTPAGLKLIDSEGNTLDIDGDVIGTVGKNYFIIFKNNRYTLMNSDGQIVIQDLGIMDYCSEVKSFHNEEEQCDFVITPDAVIKKGLNSLDIVASFPTGLYFSYNKENDIYEAYDSIGTYLGQGSDLDSLRNKYRVEVKKDRQLVNNKALYEKVIISEFQRYIELCDYEPKNLLDMLLKAASLDRDFYIDLRTSRVYSDKFVHLLKISDGKRDIWVPDTAEERKVMEEFCLKRRKDNNE